jgi:hypothetical protein
MAKDFSTAKVFTTFTSNFSSPFMWLLRIRGKGKMVGRVFTLHANTSVELTL